MNTTYTRRTTPELSVGDVVLNAGMRVRLDKKKIHDHSDHHGEPRNTRMVHHFCGTVLNAEEVIANGLPARFLRGQIGHGPGRKDFWCIQGNEGANWSVEN